MSACYLVGAFDLLNVRHLDVVDQLRSTYGRLVVAVLADDEITALNGRAPVVALAERMRLLEHVRGVDRVCVYGDVPLAPGTNTFAIEGERLPADAQLQWVRARRDTVSVAVREATSPLPGVMVA